MSTVAQKYAHQRVVLLEIRLPVTVELTVGTDDEDPSDESNWEIVDVRRATCDATIPMLNEQLDDVDHEALAVAAASRQRRGPAVTWVPAYPTPPRHAARERERLATGARLPRLCSRELGRAFGRHAARNRDRS